MTAVPQRNRSQVPLYGALPAGKLFALGIVRSKETHSTTSACISFSCLFRPAPVPARASPVHLTTLPLQNSTPRGSRYHILAGRFTPGSRFQAEKTTVNQQRHHPYRPLPTGTMDRGLGKAAAQAVSRTHCVLPPKHSLAKKVEDTGAVIMSTWTGLTLSSVLY